jgi:hypothetical protein
MYVGKNRSARGALVVPTAESASAIASEPTGASGTGNHRYATPNARVCAEIKPMAAAAAASAAKAYDSADGGGAG